MAERSARDGDGAGVGDTVGAGDAVGEGEVVGEDAALLDGASEGNVAVEDSVPSGALAQAVITKLMSRARTRGFMAAL